MRLEHSYNMVQNPIDLLLLDGRLPSSRLLTVALTGAQGGPNAETADYDTDPAEQQKLKDLSCARDKGAQCGQLFARDKGLQRRQRHSAEKDDAEGVSRIERPNKP
jgi:hypothetical protein